MVTLVAPEKQVSDSGKEVNLQSRPSGDFSLLTV